MFATGGDYIGKGAYGCIFRPVFPCKSGKYIDSSHKGNVVKVGDGTLDKEAELAAILSKYKVAPKYFVLARESTKCSPPPLEKYDSDWAKCAPYVKSPRSLSSMIQLPYGGLNWDIWRQRKLNVETFDIYRFGQHILEAVALMTLAGVVHRDLHSKNYLIDSNGVPRIIDFGLAFVVKRDTYTLDDLYPFSVSYNQIPPEMSIWDARWYTQPTDAAAAAGKHMQLDRAIELTVQRRYPLQVRRLLFNYPAERDAAELKMYIKGSELFQKGDIAQWWKYNWTKYDSWSCGTLLLGLLHELMKYSAFSRNRVAMEKKDVMLKVLYKMLHPSPLMRVDAVEALAEWAPQSAVIRAHGRDWLAALTPAP